jgi:amino acid transporter
MDIIANTAAESKALADAESMKLGARKISLRIVMLYTMSVLMASFVVPSNHPFLNGQATSDGAQSIFVIAVVEAGLPNLAHFLNAVYVFSAFTSSICMVYVATRVMHTLALQHQTGPEWITRRLRTCRAGVPTRAVLVSGVLMLVAYLGRTGAIGQVCQPA